MVDDDLVALAIDGRIRLGRRTAEGEGEIAQRHDQRAELHRALEAQELVGEVTADQRRQVNQRRVTAVKAGGFAVAEHEMLRQVEREQRPHAVIAKPLPHLGGEQAGQLRRVTEPGLRVSRVGPARCRRKRFFDGGRINHANSLPNSSTA